MSNDCVIFLVFQSNKTEVIYYDFGSLVLVYLNADKADEAYHILKQSTFEDRPILTMILPLLKPANLPEDVQPLLVMVNVKSGGCQVSLFVIWKWAFSILLLLWFSLLKNLKKSWLVRSGQNSFWKYYYYYYLMWNKFNFYIYLCIYNSLFFI